MATKQSDEKEAFWRMALIEQQASGMSIKAFCLQQGLSAPSFSWWKREIKKRDQRSAPRRVNKQKGKKSNGTTLIPVKVTAGDSPVQAESDLPRTEHSLLEVVSPTGYTFRMRAESPPPCLTILLDAITACKSIGGAS